MNIQQLEYILAVNKHRHFARAAEECGVTQPTLSMMIQKMEEDLEVKIFNRAHHPVTPTTIGKRIIEQARVSLKSLNQIQAIVDNEQNQIKGIFKLGMIPTLATYLVPEILKVWKDQNRLFGHEIELIITENVSSQLMSDLYDGKLDGIILAGPLKQQRTIEYPLYYEKFYAYVSNEEKYEGDVDLDKLDIRDVWLLENIHCFRGQIEWLCKQKKESKQNNLSVQYNAGSVNTLINIVDDIGGITIIPEMMAMSLNDKQKANLRCFKGTVVTREVCMVTHEEYVRKKMLKIIINTIKSAVPKKMLSSKLAKYVAEVKIP